MTKKHLSPSQLDMLRRCQCQYEFRYVKGLKRPPGVAMIVGTATHRAIEADLRSKMATKALLPLEAVQQAAEESLRNTWAGESPDLNDDEKAKGADTVKGEAVDTAVALARLHHDVLAPEIEPIHLEREVYLELAGFPYDIKGFIDIQEEGCIRDTKTSSKAPDGDEATRSTQGKLYSLARSVLDQKPPALFKLDYLVKTKEAKAVTVEAQMDGDDHSRLLWMVERAAKIIEAGTFMPCPSDSWVCDSRWCGYYLDLCPFGAKQRVVI